MSERNAGVHQMSREKATFATAGEPSRWEASSSSSARRDESSRREDSQRQETSSRAAERARGATTSSRKQGDSSSSQAESSSGEQKKLDRRKEDLNRGQEAFNSGQTKFPTHRNCGGERGSLSPISSGQTFKSSSRAAEDTRIIPPQNSRTTDMLLKNQDFFTSRSESSSRSPVEKEDCPLLYDKGSTRKGKGSSRKYDDIEGVERDAGSDGIRSNGYLPIRASSKGSGTVLKSNNHSNCYDSTCYDDRGKVREKVYGNEPQLSRCNHSQGARFNPSDPRQKFDFVNPRACDNFQEGSGTAINVSGSNPQKKQPSGIDSSTNAAFRAKPQKKKKPRVPSRSRIFPTLENIRDIINPSVGDEEDGEVPKNIRIRQAMFRYIALPCAFVLFFIYFDKLSTYALGRLTNFIQQWRGIENEKIPWRVRPSYWKSSKEKQKEKLSLKLHKQLSLKFDGHEDNFGSPYYSNIFGSQNHGIDGYGSGYSNPLREDETEDFAEPNARHSAHQRRKPRHFQSRRFDDNIDENNSPDSDDPDFDAWTHRHFGDGYRDMKKEDLARKKLQQKEFHSLRQQASSETSSFLEKREKNSRESENTKKVKKDANRKEKSRSHHKHHDRQHQNKKGESVIEKITSKKTSNHGAEHREKKGPPPEASLAQLLTDPTLSAFPEHSDDPADDAEYWSDALLSAPGTVPNDQRSSWIQKRDTSNELRQKHDATEILKGTGKVMKGNGDVLQDEVEVPGEWPKEYADHDRSPSHDTDEWPKEYADHDSYRSDLLHSNALEIQSTSQSTTVSGSKHTKRWQTSTQNDRQDKGGSKHTAGKEHNGKEGTVADETMGEMTVQRPQKKRLLRREMVSSSYIEASGDSYIEASGDPFMTLAEYSENQKDLRHDSIEHPSSKHDSIEHPSSKHDSIEHPSSKHDSIEHPSSKHDSKIHDLKSDGSHEHTKGSSALEERAFSSKNPEKGALNQHAGSSSLQMHPPSKKDKDGDEDDDEGRKTKPEDETLEEDAAQVQSGMSGADKDDDSAMAIAEYTRPKKCSEVFWFPEGTLPGHGNVQDDDLDSLESSIRAVHGDKSKSSSASDMAKKAWSVFDNRRACQLFCQKNGDAVPEAKLRGCVDSLLEHWDTSSNTVPSAADCDGDMLEKLISESSNYLRSGRDRNPDGQITLGDLQFLNVDAWRMGLADLTLPERLRDYYVMTKCFTNIIANGEQAKALKLRLVSRPFFTTKRDLSTTNMVRAKISTRFTVARFCMNMPHVENGEFTLESGKTKPEKMSAFYLQKVFEVCSRLMLNLYEVFEGQCEALRRAGGGVCQSQVPGGGQGDSKLEEEDEVDEVFAQLAEHRHPSQHDNGDDGFVQLKASQEKKLAELSGQHNNAGLQQKNGLKGYHDVGVTSATENKDQHSSQHDDGPENESQIISFAETTNAKTTRKQSLEERVTSLADKELKLIEGESVILEKEHKSSGDSSSVEKNTEFASRQESASLEKKSESTSKERKSPSSSVEQRSPSATEEYSSEKHSPHKKETKDSAVRVEQSGEKRSSALEKQSENPPNALEKEEKQSTTLETEKKKKIHRKQKDKELPILSQMELTKVKRELAKVNLDQQYEMQYEMLRGYELQTIEKKEEKECCEQIKEDMNTAQCTEKLEDAEKGNDTNPPSGPFSEDEFEEFRKNCLEKIKFGAKPGNSPSDGADSFAKMQKALSKAKEKNEQRLKKEAKEFEYALFKGGHLSPAEKARKVKEMKSLNNDMSNPHSQVDANEAMGGVTGCR